MNRNKRSTGISLLLACISFVISSYGSSGMPHVVDCIMGPNWSTHPVSGDYPHKSDTFYTTRDIANNTVKRCEKVVGDVNYNEKDQTTRIFTRCYDPNTDNYSIPIKVVYHPAQNHKTNCYSDSYTNNKTAFVMDCQRATDNWEGHVQVLYVECAIDGNPKSHTIFERL